MIPVAALIGIVIGPRQTGATFRQLVRPETGAVSLLHRRAGGINGGIVTGPESEWSRSQSRDRYSETTVRVVEKSWNPRPQSCYLADTVSIFKRKESSQPLSKRC